MGVTIDPTSGRVQGELNYINEKIKVWLFIYDVTIREGGCQMMTSDDLGGWGGTANDDK